MRRHKTIYSHAAAPVNVQSISDEDFRKKYADRVRHGKTSREHAKDGSWSNRFANRQIPIRQTSSHKMAAQDNRPYSFWHSTGAAK